VLRLALAYLTFPGVVVHEFAHAWACHRLGIAVRKVCYLRLGNPLGYVLHERPAYAIQHILVAVAPFFVSTAIALAISLAATLFVASHALEEFQEIVVAFSMWLGFSIALHAFPSSGDADSLWHEVTSPDVGVFAKLVLVPVVGMIRLAGIGSRVWLDVLFAILIVALPPLIAAAAMA
jgi:Putative zincin peptidase